MTTVAGIIAATAGLALLLWWMFRRPLWHCVCGRCRKPRTSYPLCRLSAPDATAWLEFENGPMGGRSVQLQVPAFSVGSTAANDLVLSDPAVSDQHLVIALQGKRIVMKDQGSTNGVYVNGVRVRSFVLASGDRLKIGNSDAILRLH